MSMVKGSDLLFYYDLLNSPPDTTKYNAKNSTMKLYSFGGALQPSGSNAEHKLIMVAPALTGFEVNATSNWKTAKDTIMSSSTAALADLNNELNDTIQAWYSNKNDFKYKKLEDGSRQMRALNENNYRSLGKVRTASTTAKVFDGTDIDVGNPSIRSTLLSDPKAYKYYFKDGIAKVYKFEGDEGTVIKYNELTPLKSYLEYLAQIMIGDTELADGVQVWNSPTNGTMVDSLIKQLPPTGFQLQGNNWNRYVPGTFELVHGRYGNIAGLLVKTLSIRPSTLTTNTGDYYSAEVDITFEFTRLMLKQDFLSMIGAKVGKDNANNDNYTNSGVEKADYVTSFYTPKVKAYDANQTTTSGNGSSSNKGEGT